MSKNRDQGTRWQREVVDRIHALTRRKADFLPERGSKDRGDIWITTPSHHDPIVVLAWKRLVKREGKKRRGPMGCKEMVVMTFDDFLRLVEQAHHEQGFIVECKAAEKVSVSTVLMKAIRKARGT